jgi:hypothetical protein
MTRQNPDIVRAKRNGIVDIWNAFMLVGVSYDVHDIPICPSTATDAPRHLISWPEAKRLHNSRLRGGEKNYKREEFIHFYVDDVKFDGKKSGIWIQPWKALEIIRHFGGIITPDYSICQDFPEPQKMGAVFRMRAFGFWAGRQGIKVINNIRWGTWETWDYCFAGIPRGSIVAVGTVASGLRSRNNRLIFENGFKRMVEVIRPQTVLIYGSGNQTCIKEACNAGVKVLTFESETHMAFCGVKTNE